MTELKELLGKTLVKLIGAKQGSMEVTLTCSDGTSYIMYNNDEYDDEAEVTKILGDVTNLLHSPIILAECFEIRSHVGSMQAMPPEADVITYFNLATIKGEVRIEWFYNSDGYSEELVLFQQLKEKTND